MLPFVPRRGKVLRGTHQALLVRKMVFSAGHQFPQNGLCPVRWRASHNRLVQLVRQPEYVFVFGVDFRDKNRVHLAPLEKSHNQPPRSSVHSTAVSEFQSLN
jgi:hypothetical protein